MAIVVFQHSPLTGARRLGATLRDYGHRLRTIELHEGDPLPVDLDDVDGVVTCGGPQSANDAGDWLAAEEQYVRWAHEAGLPVVGICLGSQILASAFGGRVEPVDGGIELGWHELELTPAGREDIIHTGTAWQSMQFHWHREEVAELPADARLLASSQRCRVQSWSIGMRTYAFQHHPEVDPETIVAWAQDEPEALEQAGVTLEQLREQTEQHYPAFERLSRRLFESIALFLMPVDRRYQGLVRDLYH